MSKIKYTVKENNRVGTHSFYAIPVPTGVLDFKELCEEHVRTILTALRKCLVVSLDL